MEIERMPFELREGQWHADLKIKFPLSFSGP
jgi:hypothetical protein